MGKPFLVVAGNIGSGKSTVVERLGAELGIPAWPAAAEQNPYLERFYGDMPRWAYQSQLFFLAQGLHQHRQIEVRGAGALLDRSLYEHYLIFAQQLHDDGYISAEDFAVLSDLYYGLQDLIAPPHLVVMLEASTPVLQERLAGHEQAISPEYLDSLQQRYRTFADGWVASPLLRIDTEQLDPRTEAGLDELVGRVLAQLGLD